MVIELPFGTPTRLAAKLHMEVLFSMRPVGMMYGICWDKVEQPGMIWDSVGESIYIYAYIIIHIV